MSQQTSVVKPILWDGERVRILDQTQLPIRMRYETCHKVSDVWWAIKTLKVRGAPLIGIAAAIGFWLGMKKARVRAPMPLLVQARKLKEYLATSRPTAVNLFWALDRMYEAVYVHLDRSREEILTVLKKEVEKIIDEDTRMCLAMGQHGAGLIRSGQSLLTVCNAGGLATSGYGTALGVFYCAHHQGKKIRVYACETRPLLQGARLTSWELFQQGVDVTLICDNMAADLMRRGRIDGVFVGADRIAANGDFANKIGTYSLAVSARYHRIPFYCVAPSSTLDLAIVRGADIPIEERDPSEVTTLYFKERTAPKGVKVFNPAFDVTSADLVTAIITECGVIKPPFKKNLRACHIGSGDKQGMR